MAIPNASDSTTVESTMTGQRGKFSVHRDAHEKIMGVLTNLYEDPEGAAVREYLTNGLDAQRERQAKDPSFVWRPIEVTTPSHFNKTYKIRDFGVGMSVNDIENVYSQYGYSTKEHTNDQTGMLGLGSKCGLTYTGQFTVTGYKGGIRTRALITLNENDVPEYVIMDTSKTDEPDGVEIAIPVKDRNTFAEKTKQFLRWWKDGEVLVDGVEPTKHGLTEVKPGVFLIERSGHSYRHDTPQSYVIMGNVPYAVDAEYVDESLRDAGMGFAAYVPMGAVDFPPNRERLRYNTRTKAAVSKISEGLFEAILAEKIKEITDAPDHRTAWLKHAALPSHFARHSKAKNLNYKGLAFEERHLHTHMTLDWDWKGNGQISERQWVTLSLGMRGALVVTGVTQGTKPTSYFKKKVRHYIATQGHDFDFAFLVDDDIDNGWLDHLPRIDAETIKALKLPKTTTNAGPRAEAPFEFYTVDSKGNTSYDSQVTIPVPAGKTLAYISPQDMKETYRKRGCEPTALINRLGEDVILVVTGKNRFDKFLRSYPTAVHAKVVVQDKINSLVASATDAEYLIGKLSYGEKEFLGSVKVADVNDPELVALAQAVQAKGTTANYAKAEELHIFSSRADINTTLPNKKNVTNNVAKRYPLIDHMGARQLTHLTIYINAVYASLNIAQP